MKTKHKTRKSASKRFIITKNGKVLHRGHGLRHLISNKSKRRMRSLKQMKLLIGRGARNIKKMIGK